MKPTKKMDFKNKLMRHREDIIKDLDVKHILDELFTKNALTHEDFDHLLILTERDRIQSARYLLDTLILTDSKNAYEAFVNSLCKDYHWLWLKLAEDSDSDQYMNDSFEDSLSKGDVPRLPDHHVKRIAVEQNVVSKLKQLTRHRILALHGMLGSGKTCVAISALRDNPDLISNNFNGVVSWLNLGNCKTDDDIVAQQTKLLRKASTVYMHNSHMNSTISMSSIGSLGDSYSQPTSDYTWFDLKDRLKTQFSNQPLKESLLVLDEVNDRKCVEAFDIGCKMLIITRDADVVANYDSQIIKIENSFELEESLELFAFCLDESVSKLPRQAVKLHKICKGSPFHIGFIGAQLAENREKLKDDPKHWDYYVKELEKKDFFFFTRPNYNPMKPIEVCINSLNKNWLPLFKMLSVFPDNVKVSANVLSKLWNKNVTEVDSIMEQLKNKSLIIKNYNREQKNYIYEIHDLIMNYLRTCANEEETKRLHDIFLNSYQYNNINNVPLEIIDDGYIAFYIGYHILNTSNINDKWSLFRKLFLNLKFLGNKVRLTGPADVMLDLQKYENYIATNNLDRDLIQSIKMYLSTHGNDLYYYPCTDIVQSIQQHESKGILFTKASQIAQENCDKNQLYFEFLHEQDVDEIKHSTIDVKETITSVCFLGDHVIVGTMNGVIKFFHVPTNKLKKEIHEMEATKAAPIKWIGVVCSKHPPIVTALFCNGIIKLWHVDDIVCDESEDIIEEEPEESYNNNCPYNIQIESKLGPIINCRWSVNEDMLIAHTTKMIIIYRPNGRVDSVINSFEKDCELLCCVPCYNDRYVAVATCGSRKCVEVIDLKTKTRVMIFEDTSLEADIVLDILAVPDSNKIITLKEREITQHEYKINPITKYNICQTVTVLKSSDVKADLKFLSMAVNKTGTLLFVSTNDSRVICIDLKTNSRAFDLENRRGNVVAMAVSDVMWDEFAPGPDVLLTGTGTSENSAKVWYLDASYISQNTNKNGKVRLTTKFDVSFLNPTSPYSPSTTPNSGTESATSTPKRHQSFANHKEILKKPIKNTMSLDRLSLKPLNLKGICNNNEGNIYPLLAVVDDKNNIQIMRGRKMLTEISEKPDDHITIVKITPCNQHIIYGLRSGDVKRYTLRTKEIVTIMDVYSSVQYMNYVNPNLLMVAGKNHCMMAYRLTDDGEWTTQMLQRGNTHLGSQELLNDLKGLKNGQPDGISSSDSDTSNSRERLFPKGNSKERLCEISGLVDCFWIVDVGLITVENNATIKLWNQNLELACILNARQTDVNISCAALKKNILAICDSFNKRFQTFELKEVVRMELNTIQVSKLNNAIVSCDLTADGNILAMGLDSGNVVIQNVKGKRQIGLLRHHKTKVQWCKFSPVPDRLFRSPSSQMSPFGQSSNGSEDDQPPLVLVTMASEIVWWNVSYVMKMRSNVTIGRPGLNALSPLASPLENRNEVQLPKDNINMGTSNFFFGDGSINKRCWKNIWKGKTYKDGSKRKEILSCIKLSGMNAKKLCFDDPFSCFVTVDNPGHIHIMNIMRSDCT